MHPDTEERFVVFGVTRGGMGHVPQIIPAGEGTDPAGIVRLAESLARNMPDLDRVEIRGRDHIPYSIEHFKREWCGGAS